MILWKVKTDNHIYLWMLKSYMDWKQYMNKLIEKKIHWELFKKKKLPFLWKLLPEIHWRSQSGRFTTAKAP